jgi:DNA/RNA endonuclease YhcR with UshA esterase domain
MGLAAIAASSALVLGACGGGGNAPAGHQGAPAPGAAPNSGGSAAIASSCVPSSPILNNTQAYADKPVTVTGTVAQVVGQHAFTVSPSTNNSGSGIAGNSNSNAQTLLAVDKQATQPSPGSPVEVTGTFQPTFDSNQAATFTGGSLGQGSFTQFNGKPYVQAEFAGPISSNLTGGAQNGGIINGGNNGGSSCAAASDVLSNTQSYTGKPVTVTGTVAQVLGPNAVTIAATGSNNGNNAQTLLAVAKENLPLNPGSPVQVTGTLQPTFDTNQAQTFTGSNLDPATFTPYNGKPYVEAVYAGPASANLTSSNNGQP